MDDYMPQHIRDFVDEGMGEVVPPFDPDDPDSVNEGNEVWEEERSLERDFD